MLELHVLRSKSKPREGLCNDEYNLQPSGVGQESPGISRGSLKNNPGGDVHRAFTISLETLPNDNYFCFAMILLSMLDRGVLKGAICYSGSSH